MSYRIAADLEQALRSLGESRGECRVIAGGTDLYLGNLPPALVDLTAVTEIAVLLEKEGQLMIGACVTHAAAAASPLLSVKATALAQACLQVGSPQVRNLGTLGGNVVNAAPAADAAAALVALGARAVIVDTGSSYREEFVEDLYEQYYRSKVDSSKEILLHFLLKSHGPGEGSAFQRFASRKALSLPMFSVAASVRLEHGLLREVKLVAAPVKPAPTRLVQTEEKLKGLPAGAETWRLAAEWAREEITVRSSRLRCTAEYRRHLAGVLTGRVLEDAVHRAEQAKAGEDR